MCGTWMARGRSDGLSWGKSGRVSGTLTLMTMATHQTAVTILKNRPCCGCHRRRFRRCRKRAPGSGLGRSAKDRLFCDRSKRFRTLPLLPFHRTLIQTAVSTVSNLDFGSLGSCGWLFSVDHLILC